MDDNLIYRLLTEHKDSKGMQVMFREYYRPLVMWADSFLKDVPLAEDLVQDFFVSFWKERLYERLTPSGLKGYLFTSVRNRALNLIEKKDPLRMATRDLPLEQQMEDTDYYTEETLQRIEAEVDKLPKRMQEVLRAVYIDGLSYQAAAEKFSISKATVKVMLVNALKRIRKDCCNFF